MKRLIPMAIAILTFALTGCSGGISPYADVPPPPAAGPPDPASSLEGILETPGEEELKSIVGGDDASASRAELTHRERALRQCRDEIGYREQGGENCNKYSEYFKRGCEPWCADFVSWAYDTTSTNPDHQSAWETPSWVGHITDWGRKNNMMVNQPARGDIFTYQNGKHTGIVAKVQGSVFWTVEGNTNGKDGTTTWVYGHKRSVSGPYHFIRVEYQD